MSLLHTYTRMGQEGIVGYQFWCKGCERPHYFDVVADPERPNMPVWRFNGDLESPTVSPSILIRAGHAGGKKTTCHLFLRSGQVQYLNDCDHPLAGETIQLPPFPDDW